MSTVPSQPNIFIRPDAGDQILQFFWSPPDSDGGSAITSYVLTDGTITQTLPSNFGYYRLGGLINGQNYSFTLAASNAIGLGLAASFRTVQPGTIPDAPTNLSTASAGGSSYQISWTNAVNTGGASLLGTVLTAIPVDSNDQPDYANSNAFIRQSVDKSLQSAIIPLTSSYNYKVLVQNVNDPGYSPPLLFTSTLNGSGLPAGSGSSLLSYARLLNTQYSSSISPTSAGSLTINSQSIGNHDFCVRGGSTTISSFVATDYFTTTEDTASAWIIVKGNLTIDSGQTFIPSVRKLFTVLYVTGNLINNGTISMTARGANHSGTGNSGGFTAPVDIRVGTGTFSAITNPQIPATGGAGALGTNIDNQVVNGGSATNGGTAGGGAGGKFSGSGSSGGGAAGTCFSGGGGGGGMLGSSLNGGTAVANGGKGGDARGSVSAGGSGNPGGTGTGGAFGPDGNVGTGGTLIVIVEGSLSGSGVIQANGVAGARASGQVGGGGSGGGSVTVLFGTNPSSAVSVTATGGAGSSCGSGGNGTARKLAIGIN